MKRSLHSVISGYLTKASEQPQPINKLLLEETTEVSSSKYDNGDDNNE